MLKKSSFSPRLYIQRGAFALVSRSPLLLLPSVFPHLSAAKRDRVRRSRGPPPGRVYLILPHLPACAGFAYSPLLFSQFPFGRCFFSDSPSKTLSLLPRMLGALVFFPETGPFFFLLGDALGSSRDIPLVSCVSRFSWSVGLGNCFSGMALDALFSRAPGQGYHLSFLSSLDLVAFSLRIRLSSQREHGHLGRRRFSPSHPLSLFPPLLPRLFPSFEGQCPNFDLPPWDRSYASLSQLLPPIGPKPPPSLFRVKVCSGGCFWCPFFPLSEVGRGSPSVRPNIFSQIYLFLIGVLAERFGPNFCEGETPL